MPYSSKAKFQHAERRRRFKPSRIRTVTLRDGREIRLGFDAKGHGEVVSVLTPIPNASSGQRRAADRWLDAVRTYGANSQRAEHARDTYRRSMGYDTGREGHYHSHASPSHHVGNVCDSACRHGDTIHFHRTNRRKR